MKPVTALAAALLALCFATVPANAADRPNVVVFLVDDMGWGDLGCYGHPLIQSPNLDRFAAEGVRFTQCYSACGVCSPSRSSILTGRTPYRNGVWRWIPGGHPTHLRESEVTLPELLKGAGYATCHVGKWHLNGHFNDERQPQPDDHGYEHWMATQNNAAPSHKNPRNFVRNGEEVGELEGFSAPLVVAEATRWLREIRDKEKPFLLSVWTHEPHLPIESAEAFMAPYADIDDEGIRQHHGNITQIDHAFGALMAALDELGLSGDTIVFFTSDNGPEGRTADKGRTRGSTGGLRGRKRDSHEGGIRVPGMVRWPGHIEPGTVSKVPVIGSDIFSTVLAIAGIDAPADRTIDGTDIRPAFRGEGVERAVPLFWRTHIAPDKSHAAMRVGDWKLVADKSFTEFQLYEIEKDPFEERDLAAALPDKVEAMRAQFMEVWRGIESEGPREWWESEPERGRSAPRAKVKAAPLGDGEDKTGKWPLVRGGTVTEGPGGMSHLESAGEAFALRPLDPPLTGDAKATFRVRYRSAAADRTRNAMFCFGADPTNDGLVKAGTAIGMNQHVLFDGGWANLAAGEAAPGHFEIDDSFTARVTVDLGAGEVLLEVGGQTLKRPLPAGLKEVRHYGIYTKATASLFSEVERE